MNLKNKYENSIINIKNRQILILKYNNCNNIIIKFLDTNTILKTTLRSIKNESIKDPYYPSVYGVGFFGIGKYKSRENSKSKQTRCYKIWKEILNRCYNKKCKAYKNYGNIGVKICDEWLNFQNFADWYYNNYKNNNFCLDKDLLVKNNKIYSPSTCCFIPICINNLLTKRQNFRGKYPIGVRSGNNIIQSQINFMGKKKYIGSFKNGIDAFNAYKIEKEKCIKLYADKYKNELDKSVYNALYNYKVEIND